MPLSVENVIQEFIRKLNNPNISLDNLLADFISQLIELDTSKLSIKQRKLIQSLIDRIYILLQKLNPRLAEELKNIQIRNLIKENSPPKQLNKETSNASLFSYEREESEDLNIKGAWEEYLKNGDGHFNERGLSQFLNSKGLNARVISSSEFSVKVLGIDLGYPDERIYLVPDFHLPPRAVKEFFDFSGTVSKLGRINKIIRLALVKKTSSGIEILRKGIVS